MLRKITGFSTDEKGDWVADLECYHGQHVRHKPPFTRRPWVITQDGRNSRLGQELDCLKCNRMEWPEDLAINRRTAELNEKSMPEYFKKSYSLPTGIWGKIIVLHGELNYKINDPFELCSEIVTGESAIIVPDTNCLIVPSVDTRFCIEFYVRD